MVAMAMLHKAVAKEAAIHSDGHQLPKTVELLRQGERLQRRVTEGVSFSPNNYFCESFACA